jgi:hypothetical protein
MTLKRPQAQKEPESFTGVMRNITSTIQSKTESFLKNPFSRTIQSSKGPRPIRKILYPDRVRSIKTPPSSSYGRRNIDIKQQLRN